VIAFFFGLGWVGTLTEKAKREQIFNGLFSPYGFRTIFALIKKRGSTAPLGCFLSTPTKTRRF